MLLWSLTCGNTQTAVISGTFFTLSSICFSFCFQFRSSTFVIFLDFGMASDDKDVVVTRLANEEGGKEFTKSCIVVRETVPHWNVAEDRRLHQNTLNAERVDVLFGDGWSFTMFGSMSVRIVL